MSSTPAPVREAVVPSWPTPLATTLANALADILEAMGDRTTAITDIRAIAVEALRFDPARMRLRFDDLHGNRSFVQVVDGRWKATRIDGREVHLSYCFGPGADDAAIERDLSTAHTVHSIERAASAHINGLQTVQVEMTWERNHWNGERFVR